MSRFFDALRQRQNLDTGLEAPLAEIIAESASSARKQPAAEGGMEVDTPAPAPIANIPAPEMGALGAARTVSLRLKSGAPLLPFDGAQPRVSEQYRMLRTKLVQHPKAPKVIGITSPGKADGKSSTAINLAGALSLKYNVLLVDADFRRSSIESSLGISRGLGLAQVLAGTAELSDAIVQTEQFPRLFVLMAGEADANPAELLDGGRWTAVCAALREAYSYIIVDCPPVGAIADYDLIEVCCDGMIVIARPDHTNRRECAKALAAIPREKLLGVVMNSLSTWFSFSNGSPYYYGTTASETTAR